MALTPDTDQFSQFLRLAFLRSPGYAAGSSGWTINQDGSVEFNNGTFRGNIVGGALYIYSGAPALGNPPQLAIVPPGTANDPFGNAVTSSKILMQGNVITESGGIFRTAAAAPLIQLDGPHDAVFIYDAAAHLVDSITPVATNDGIGHTVYAGIVNYSAAADAVAQLLSGGLNVGTGAQIAGTGGKQAAEFRVGGGVEGELLIDGGLNGSTDVSAQIILFSKGASGGVATPYMQLQQQLMLGSPASPVQLATASLFADANGLARMLSGITGDTNQYFMAWSITAASAVPQTISSTTPTTITGCSFVVGAGLYRFRARVTFSGGAAAGTASFSVTGPAISNSWINALFNMSNGTAGAGAQNSSLGPVISPTLTTGQNVADIEGDVTFSASGTIALACAEGVATDTVIIQHAHFWLYPIT